MKFKDRLVKGTLQNQVACEQITDVQLWKNVTQVSEADSSVEFVLHTSACFFQKSTYKNSNKTNLCFR